MKSWILWLVIWGNGMPSQAAARFETFDACQAAKDTVLKEFGPNAKAVCLDAPRMAK